MLVKLVSDVANLTSKERLEHSSTGSRSDNQIPDYPDSLERGVFLSAHVVYNASYNLIGSTKLYCIPIKKTSHECMAIEK